jgi:hypothetical protein
MTGSDKATQGARYNPDHSEPIVSSRLGLWWFELEGQLVDLAGELERNLVAVLDERQRGAGVLADVEDFVLRNVIGVVWSIEFLATSFPST